MKNLLNNMFQSSTENQKIWSLLTQILMDSYPESKVSIFPFTRVNSESPFYYCQSGIPKRIYTHSLNIPGKHYSDIFEFHLHPLLQSFLKQYHFAGTSYMITDNEKEIGIVFQSTPSSTLSPLAFAELLDNALQTEYSTCLSHSTGRYCNTTALSEPVTGVEGIREGYLQTEELKATSFFRMSPGVMTRERLERLKNHVTYRDVINLTRMLCQAVAQGEDAKGLALSEQLFLDMLKHSFDTELVCDALSYLKQFLSIRLSVYLPQESFDLRALCGIASYITIEECFEALSPVLTTLCHTVKSTGAWSDSVVYAAYYLRNNIAKDVSLPEIAAFADTAPAYLSNQFHQQTGLTIKQYQQKIRMELACELLEKSSERISDIAGKTGFFDRRYFTKTFKDTFGTTPAQYRERHRVGQKDQNGTI